MQSLVTLVSLSAALAGGAALFGGSEPDVLQTKGCVRAWVESRMRYPGYDHVVHLASGCSAESVCQISTNVNPQAIVAAVPAESAVEVLTFRGSPVRDFSARIGCQGP